MEYPKNDDDEEEVVDIINIYDIYGIKEIYQQTPMIIYINIRY